MKCGVIQSSQMMNWKLFNRKSVEYFGNGLSVPSNATKIVSILGEACTVLRVTVEIVPCGIEEAKRKLATMTISNVKMNRKKNVASYDVVKYEDGYAVAGTVQNYHRESGWLPLVYKSLGKLLP